MQVFRCWDIRVCLADWTSPSRTGPTALLLHPAWLQEAPPMVVPVGNWANSCDRLTFLSFVQVKDQLNSMIGLWTYGEVWFYWETLGLTCNNGLTRQSEGWEPEEPQCMKQWSMSKCLATGQPDHLKVFQMGYNYTAVLAVRALTLLPSNIHSK